MSSDAQAPATPPTPPSDRPEEHRPSPSLREIGWVFLKLGAIAFGGPAAHVAMMEDEIVKRRQWLTHEKLLDLIGVTNLLPGPNSTELAIHIGYEQAGWRGLWVAGASFILPAMTIVWILAAIYARYQTLPQLEWLLYGIKPVIVVIILQALWKLGRKAIKNYSTAIAAIAVLGCFFLGAQEILLLVLAGLGVMFYRQARQFPLGFGLLPLTPAIAGVTPTQGQFPATTLQVFLFFLKIGSVLYGSGYVLLAFLQRDLVERSGWITSQQLLDAIAVGQVTPGPVFTTATFVGYLLAGSPGAIAGTVGIFLPAFILVGIVNPWVPKLRQSKWVSSFLDGVNAGSLGLMASVSYTLGQAALRDPITITLAIASAVALFRFKVSSMILIVLGGAIGIAVQYGEILARLGWS